MRYIALSLSQRRSATRRRASHVCGADSGRRAACNGGGGGDGLPVRRLFDAGVGVVRSAREKKMWKRFSSSVAQYGRGAWRGLQRARELLALFGAKRKRDREETLRIAARARFWAELRDGQREAEAHGARRGS